MKVNDKSVRLESSKDIKPSVNEGGGNTKTKWSRGSIDNIINLKLHKPNGSVGNRAVLQYPYNRLNLYEQLAYDSMLDSMYKDNMIFTAYDLNGRKRTELAGILGSIMGGKDNYGMTNSNNMVANIMMPRSDTDIDHHKHEFVTSEESLMSRGNGSFGNAVGSGMATMVSGVFDNISKGFFADHGEAIGTPTRATYKGADHRTKTFSWKLTPRNAKDLNALLSILKVFVILSYGNSHKSKEVSKGISGVQNWVEANIFSNFRSEGNQTETITNSILESFKYVKVMSNPTLWFIRNYNHGSLGGQNSSIFGPANIVDIKVNSTPDGHFNGLAKYPNFSSSYIIEITFREALSHTRDTIMGVL